MAVLGFALHSSRCTPLPDLSTPAALPGRAAAPTWRTSLAQRFRHHQLLKIGGVCLFMWVFFAGYFHVLRNPVYPVTTMPLTALDAWIPFVPQALAIYLSLWFYVGIPAGLAADLRHALRYGAWAGGLCATGLAIFWFWPSAIPPTGMDLSGYPGFAMIHGLDAAGNACPSLHVATAVFAAWWVDHTLRDMRAPGVLRWVNVAWCVGIAWSTVAVRQHVVLDVAGGLLLGALFALASRPGRKPL